MAPPIIFFKENIRMKQIRHKGDNSAYLHTLRNCEPCGSVNGYELYKQDFGKKPIAVVYIHIKGTADLCDTAGYDIYDLDKFMEQLRHLPEQRLIEFATVDGKLEYIRKCIDAQKWTSNGDALFCECVGKYELAEEVRKNRELYIARREAEEQKLKTEEAERMRIKAERTARELDERLKQALQKWNDGEFIEAKDFELLCNKYGVKLSTKFVGWLREWCISVSKKQYEIKRDRYSNREHYSSVIGVYGSKLTEAIMK